MDLSNIPDQMVEEPRWVLWKYVDRGGKPTKVPFQVTGQAASSINKDQWSSCDEVCSTYSDGGYSGIGFVLGDGWAGVDLDDCINDKGEMAPWALSVVQTLGSYTEVSPSKAGAKIFCKGKLPVDKGCRTDVEEGSIEMYSHGRYFTVTGHRLEESGRKIRKATAPLAIVHRRHFQTESEVDIMSMSNAQICRQTLELLPESVAGEEGHNALFRAVCEVRRFDLTEEESWQEIHWFNQNKCRPQWSIAEMRHKWRSACSATDRELDDKIEQLEEVTKFDLGLVTHTEFVEKEYTQEFLVDQVVVGGEHLILGGPKKTLKTSVLIDLALSLAAGGKFLGHFDVPEPHPAIVISGESGGATLQKTAIRIQKARGVNPGNNLLWGLRLPNLSVASHLDALGNEIERTGTKLIAVDPAYLSLLAGGNEDGAANVFKMGSILNGYGKVGVDTGCTMCLVHHTRSVVKQGAFPELSDLAFSGFQEWARQWVLLNHAAKRQGGVFNLNVAVGGSAGHGGEYNIVVDEGQPRDPLIDRKWDVTVTNLSDDADEDVVPEPVEPVEPLTKTIMDFLATQPNGASKRAIRDATGKNNDYITDALNTLEHNLAIMVSRDNGPYPVYKIVPGFV